MAHSTVKVYLSAVRQLHIAEGFPDPGRAGMAKLSWVLRLHNLDSQNLQGSL